MGMYINIFEKKGNKFIQRDDLWECRKWTGRNEALDIIVNNGFCIDKTQPFSDLEQYWRPKDFEKCRKEINEMEVNDDIFGKLIDELEKNNNLFIRPD